MLEKIEKVGFVCSILLIIVLIIKMVLLIAEYWNAFDKSDVPGYQDQLAKIVAKELFKCFYFLIVAFILLYIFW